MFKNYFKTAWRNLLKSKLYSAINITGLATGIAVALLIGLWIWNELSFDHYHRNHRQIVQLMDTQTNNGKTTTSGEIAIPLENELQKKYGDRFKQLVLSSQVNPLLIATGEKKISQFGMFVQPGFPGMFTLKILRGSPAGLNDPSSALISDSLARILFGNADPIGRVLNIDGLMDAKIAGVYEDLPSNTTLSSVKILLPWEKYIIIGGFQDAETQWGNHSFYLYALLNKHVDIDKTNAEIKDIPSQHLIGSKEEIFLFPMDKWHLYSDFTDGKISGGRIQFVWLLGIIGMFVLFLACINFMNLSTARSEKRAKEVGIRKTLGSLRGQLIGQFLSESILMAMLAFVLSIFLVQESLPFINRLAAKQMTIPWINPLFWLLMLGFTLFTGFMSGSYPAFYLSSFQPIKVLKGIFKTGNLASMPRKVMVTIQFTVSIALIIGTMVVFRQVQYARDRPVGYDRGGLISLPMFDQDGFKKYQPFRSELLKTNMVEDMTESSSPTTKIENNYGDLDWTGKVANSQSMFGMIAVTHDFGKTIGWEIQDGRDFSRNTPSDSGAFILNEAAVKITGLRHPVGQIIKWEGKDRPIIGIVKDLVMESPFMPVKPTIFFLQYDDWLDFIIIKIKPGVSVHQALSKIEPVFKKYNSGSPFDYRFIDDEYAAKFSDEDRIGKLTTLFASLAIFISCLGLFGLASFVAEQRTKEIGVRKVLGASVLNLWKLLSREFLSLVVISCFIAAPLSWYFMNQWLQKYDYRTPIEWWVFVAAGLGALLITLLTVSYQSIKAALMNPVKSLRME